MWQTLTQEVPVSIDRIKKIEYHPNGLVKSIELFPVNDDPDAKPETSSLTDILGHLKNRG